MSRRPRLLALAAASVAAFLISPASPARLSAPPAGAAVGAAADTLTLNFRGTTQREKTPDPQRVQYTTDLYSLATGEKVGTGTYNAMFTSPLTADHIMTFHLPDGDLVSHDIMAVGPDATRPGFFLIGVHPDGNTIVNGTGVYAGRTGKLRMSGWHDGTKFPGQVTFNDFYAIELDPRQ